MLIKLVENVLKLYLFSILLYTGNKASTNICTCYKISTIIQLQNDLKYARGNTANFANPVTSDGSNIRGDITEEEAFQWFDEAFVYVRAGSGGAG